MISSVSAGSLCDSMGKASATMPRTLLGPFVSLTESPNPPSLMGNVAMSRAISCCVVFPGILPNKVATACHIPESWLAAYGADCCGGTVLNQ